MITKLGNYELEQAYYPQEKNRTLGDYAMIGGGIAGAGALGAGAGALGGYFAGRGIAGIEAINNPIAKKLYNKAVDNQYHLLEATGKGAAVNKILQNSKDPFFEKQIKHLLERTNVKDTPENRKNFIEAWNKETKLSNRLAPQRMKTINFLENKGVGGFVNNVKNIGGRWGKLIGAGLVGLPAAYYGYKHFTDKY